MKQILVVTGLFLLTATATTPAMARELAQVGWVEEVRLSDVGSAMKAKMDTGATTSSIDADIIDIRKTGKAEGDKPGETVVFSVTDGQGKPKTFEREIQRYVRIKLKGGGFVRRPVIEMRFCIAGRSVVEEVNLANRENFVYPVLVGRNMMAHADLVVNPARRFMSKPNCKGEK